MSGKRTNRKAPPTVMAGAHLNERREDRYLLGLEIEISGITHSGELFLERVVTRDVSEWGCGFVTSIALVADDIITVRMVATRAGDVTFGRKSVFQVRRVVPEGDAWLVGVWKMDEESTWGAELEKIVKAQPGTIELRRYDNGSEGEPQPSS